MENEHHYPRNYLQAYIDYLVYFHADRDYFECHEILEEYWKEEGMQDKVWVGLIQVAVGLYHHRRQNFAGAYKMIKGAHQLLADKQTELRVLGLDPVQLIALLQKQLEAIGQKQTYSSINLPIADPALLQTCQNMSGKSAVEWGAPSDTSNEFLIHKHKLRDREDVISERIKQQQLRKHKLDE